MKEPRQKILEFVKSERLAVMATSRDNQPEAAVVDFSETENLEIILTTLSIYRKYQNLFANPKVALVVGGAENITVQYEGVAEELTREEFAPYREYHIRKNPIEEKFAALEEARFFRITPTWVRYSNFSAKPNEIFEVTF